MSIIGCEQLQVFYFTIFFALRFLIWQCMMEATMEATTSTPATPSVKIVTEVTPN